MGIEKFTRVTRAGKNLKLKLWAHNENFRSFIKCRNEVQQELALVFSGLEIFRVTRSMLFIDGRVWDGGAAQLGLRDKLTGYEA